MLLISLFLLKCAHQVYPEGGPIDLEPPKIISTIPLPNSLNVQTNKIHFEFSEYVDRRSFEESIYISPANINPPEFDWSGKEVDLILPYNLQLNKTYTVTVGTDVVDINNRNRMAESYTLAFSTGDKIDSGFINGRVYDENPQGILISAYKIDSINPDTLNPSRKFPDYTTQSGKDGDYKLKFLAFGKYRIFAIKDIYKNLLYDPNVDKIGVYVSDIEIFDGNSSIENVNFKITSFDTSSLKLYSAEATDKNHLLLKFSKNIDLSTLSIDNFFITDSVSLEALKIQYIYVDYNKPKNIKLLTKDQKNTRYAIKVKGVMDSLEQNIDSNFSKIAFQGSSDEDTLKPVILSVSVSDSMKSFKIDNSISFTFNDIIKSDIFENSIKIKDTNNIFKKLEFERIGNSKINVKPFGLDFNTWYKIEFPIDSLVKYNNVHGKDSTLKINFKTEDKNNLSSISGNLESKDEKNQYIIEASNLDSRSKYSQKVNRDKKFSFKNIEEGKYTFFVFQDADSNKIYNYGKPFPFRGSEKFQYIQDTVKVKARWPVEGLKIRIR